MSFLHYMTVAKYAHILKSIQSVLGKWVDVCRIALPYNDTSNRHIHIEFIRGGVLVEENCET
jgi:hypothetical protein